MQTGWQLLDNQYFYLYPNGQMAVGWAEMDGNGIIFAPEKKPGILRGACRAQAGGS